MNKPAREVVPDISNEGMGSINLIRLNILVIVVIPVVFIPKMEAYEFV
jgi:hypothetical protein